MTPVEDDPDMWAAFSRLVTQMVVFLQCHGVLMGVGALMCMLIGMERGTDSRKLRIRMGIAALLVWGFVPVAIVKFDLDPIWSVALASFIGWQGSRLFKWAEALFLKRAGLTREEVEQKKPWDGVTDRRQGERKDGNE